MCTIVLLRRPGHAWPLILAANRDEMRDRPWQPPARHWPAQADVTAGRDETAGGTWLGVNDAGVVAAVSNRRGSLGADPNKRSRGELPLAALTHDDAASAAEALSRIDGDAYRAFNLIVADRQFAFWLRNADGAPKIDRFTVPDGVSVVTAGDIDDATSPRIRLYRPRFRAAAAPDPGASDWRAWQALLGCRETDDADIGDSAMNIESDRGFGTVSSSLIALPADGGPMIWRFAGGPPDTASFTDVDL
jgi:uncharacterized protein with NRDE domain